jgi:antitoxin FitA
VRSDCKGNPSIPTSAPAAINDSVAIIAIFDSNAIIERMASITIRRLEETTKRKLRIRAARHGRSMEQEAREILKAELARPEEQPQDLVESIRRRFAKYGGVDLKIPPREPIPEARIRKLFADDHS